MVSAGPKHAYLQRAAFRINHAKDLFEKLVAQRDAIEAEVGFGVEWDDWPDRKHTGSSLSGPAN